MEFILTTRGKPCLLLDGFQYRLFRKSEQTTSWLCLNSEKMKCRGMVKTNRQNVILSKTDHYCVPNIAEIEVKKAMQKCKKRVREETFVPVHKIFREEFTNIYKKGFDFIAEAPAYSSAKTSLCAERRKVLGTVENPVNIGDIQFDENTCKISEARTSMIDIRIAPYLLNNLDKRIKVFKELESILQQWNLEKKYEAAFGETHIVIFSNDSGSITSTVKAYPFGLIVVTFEYSADETSLTDPMLEEMRKLFVSKLDTRSHMIPRIKRGTSVPVYFTTADERMLEYDFNQFVFEKDSPYQNIKILHSPTIGNCLLLDDMPNLADSDINYTHGIMKYDTIPYEGKDILIIGGGDGGLLHELRKENPKFVTMVEMDKMVIDTCREHLRSCCGDSFDKLEGSNYKVIIDDCIKMLDEYKIEGRKFDIIINNLTDIPFAKSPEDEIWYFIKNILIKSFAVLKDDGSYLNYAITKGCVNSLKDYEDVLLNLPVEVKFESHMAFVPSFMDNCVFYEVKRKL